MQNLKHTVDVQKPKNVTELKQFCAEIWDKVLHSGEKVSQINAGCVNLQFFLLMRL